MEGTTVSRIIDGSLYLRNSNVSISRCPTKEGKLSTKAGRNIEVCVHLRVVSLRIHDADDTLYFGLDISNTGRRNDRYYNGGVLYQCKFCTTEFRVDFKELGELGHAIFITRWKDLGEGRSRSDPRWRCHLKPIRPGGEITWERVSFEAGSICARFEGDGFIDPVLFATPECQRWLAVM